MVDHLLEPLLQVLLPLDHPAHTVAGVLEHQIQIMLGVLDHPIQIFLGGIDHRLQIEGDVGADDFETHLLALGFLQEVLEGRLVHLVLGLLAALASTLR